VFADGVIVNVGLGLTVTVTFAVPTQPDEVPETVYVVVDVGVAVTTEPIPLDKLFVGDQLYVFAPFAVSTTFEPKHIEGDVGVTVTIGPGFTVIQTMFEVAFVPQKFKTA
jgi:hypothetical protein